LKVEPTEKAFQAKGARLAYFEWGDVDASPIFLIHATGFHARCWDQVVRAIPEDYRIIAVDQRGHGRSEKLGPVSGWSEFADDIVELVEALDLKGAIGAGHSMGAHTLVQVTHRAPAAFSRLVLVDPVMLNPDHYGTRHLQYLDRPQDHPIAKRRNEWASWQQMYERFAARPPYTLWKKEVLEDYCKYGLLPADSGDGFVLACPPLIEASVYYTNADSNIYNLLGDIESPVTVLRAKVRDHTDGEKMDFSGSPTWEGVAGCFKHGQDVYLPHLTHFIPMEEPEMVASYIVSDGATCTKG